MDNLKNGIEGISRNDYLKAQTISNKAVSNVFGFAKMLKKARYDKGNVGIKTTNIR